MNKKDYHGKGLRKQIGKPIVMGTAGDISQEVLKRLKEIFLNEGNGVPETIKINPLMPEECYKISDGDWEGIQVQNPRSRSDEDPSITTKIMSKDQALKYIDGVDPYNEDINNPSHVEFYNICKGKLEKLLQDTRDKLHNNE